jgi:hypothetical protein
MAYTFPQQIEQRSSKQRVLWVAHMYLWIVSLSLIGEYISSLRQYEESMWYKQITIAQGFFPIKNFSKTIDNVHVFLFIYALTQSYRRSY